MPLIGRNSAVPPAVVISTTGTGTELPNGYVSYTVTLSHTDAPAVLASNLFDSRIPDSIVYGIYERLEVPVNQTMHLYTYSTPDGYEKRWYALGMIRCNEEWLLKPMDWQARLAEVTIEPYVSPERGDTFVMKKVIYRVPSWDATRTYVMPSFILDGPTYDHVRYFESEVLSCYREVIASILDTSAEAELTCARFPGNWSEVREQVTR